MRYLLIVLFFVACTKKTTVTTTDRKEIIEVDKREVPAVTFEPPSRDKLIQYKVFNDTDTVYVRYREIISKTDTLYETIVDCPDMVDSTTTVTEKTKQVVTVKDSFWGRMWTFIKNGFWWIIIVAVVVVVLGILRR